MAVWRSQRVADFGLVLMSRRFPPPWTVEETDACFIVRDANGQALAYGRPGVRVPSDQKGGSPGWPRWA